MIRGTVHTFKFILPCLNTDLEWVKIKFWQPNNPSRSLPIIKQLTDCGKRVGTRLDGTKDLYVSLTAYDTAQFSDKYKAKVQLRAKQKDGVEFGMPEYITTVYPMPDDLIGYIEPLPPEDPNGLVIFDGDKIIQEEGGEQNE